MSIEAAILTWLLAQPVHHTDVGEPDRLSRLSQVAEAIGVVSNGNRLLAAQLLVQGSQESGWRLDVAECRCPHPLCDRNKSKGYYQLRPLMGNGSEWCGTSFEVQLAAATRAMVFFRGKTVEEGFRSCGGDRAKSTDKWVVDRAKRARELARKL